MIAVKRLVGPVVFAASVPAGIGALRGHRTAWAALATSVSGYLAGQWSGKRTAGAFAPTGGALAWHVATTALLVAGAALLFPSGPAERVARR